MSPCNCGAPQDTYSVRTLLDWDARSWRPKVRALNTTIIICINLFYLLYCWHTYKLRKFDLSYLLERLYWLANYSHVQRFLLNLILCVQICFKLPNNNYTSKFKNVTTMNRKITVLVPRRYEELDESLSGGYPMLDNAMQVPAVRTR